MEDTNSQHSKKHDQAVIMLVAFNSVVSGTIAFGFKSRTLPNVFVTVVVLVVRSYGVGWFGVVGVGPVAFV